MQFLLIIPYRKYNWQTIDLFKILFRASSFKSDRILRSTAREAVAPTLIRSDRTSAASAAVRRPRSFNAMRRGRLSSNETEKFNLDSCRHLPSKVGAFPDAFLSPGRVPREKCFPFSSLGQHINRARDKNSGTAVTPDRISCSCAPNGRGSLTFERPR